jgi:TrmH family RNA methyltransferase
MLITSPQNPRVKHVLRLRDRRHRERDGLMLVEGAGELAMALAAGARPQTVYFCPALAGPRAGAGLLARAQAAGAELVEVSQTVFARMAYRENPDGWLAVLPAVHRGLDDLPAALGLALFVVAEAIEKPGNLGALLRSADAAGVTGLIVCDPTTDVTNPNVVRSSRGTLFTVPLAEASTPESLAWLRARQISVVATSPQARLAYTEADLRGPVAIVVGAEDAGLRPAWLEQADLSLRIPMLGMVNSLNVATAATLLLYEALRQRGEISRNSRAI